MADDDLYDGREQTLVKHFILQHYLLRLALIVGTWSKGINYVDCFSGPWNVRGNRFEDSSFGIAVSELKKARAKLQERGIEPALRCFFLEQNPSAYENLAAFAQTVEDVEVVTKNKRLEDAVGDILEFAGSRKGFSFVFIDPTGWTGFPLNTIRRLLLLRPGEVLINFMTWHARRFIESDQEAKNFDELFGDRDWRAQLENLSGDDRDDVMVRLYSERIKKAGGFEFVCYSPVLHRETDTTHFHLIYGSRSEKGVEVFKEAERYASKLMEEKRARAQQQKRTAGGQTLLFGAQEMHDASYFTSLRERYLERVRVELHDILKRQSFLGYDDAWRLAMKHPLVWEKDLKELLQQWTKDGRVDTGGQELKRGTEAIITWRH